MTLLSRWRANPFVTVGLLLSVLYATEARAQDPTPATDSSSSSFLNAPPAAPAPASAAPADNSPVVRAAPGNWGMTFSFGGLGNLSATGLLNQKAGNLLFTELGFRTVLSSVIIPFSVGLGLANTTTRTDPSVSSTDVGLSFTGGVLKGFRVCRRIVPYFGGLFHFDVLKPSGDNNWVVDMSLGPVIGIEYYIADRVSLLAQGTFQFGVQVTNPAAQIALGSGISGGGQLGLTFYF